jgi:hypothetical protein
MPLSVKSPSLLAVIEGGPHVIPRTRANQVNTALLGFLRS